MAWQGILEHDAIVEQFRRALSRGRLASTFLFVGPDGVGKKAFARKLAQTLLCERSPEARLDPCGTCSACIQVLAGTHPDLELVAAPEGRTGLLVEQFIGTLEKRGQEGVCHSLARRPMMGTRRVVIIDDADTLQGEAANCLLKTLEEPPPHSVLILIGTSAEMQLPTVRSRCQIVRFAPLSQETVAELLVQHGLVADAAEAARLARYSEGSLARAAELADPALWDFRAKLLRSLAAQRPDSVRLARELTTFVDEAGAEAPLRRARAKQVIGFAAEFYRQLARGIAGAALSDDQELSAAVRQALTNWAGDAEAAADCAGRCLDAEEDVDRNAHLGNALECWIDELCRPLSLTGRA